MQIFEHQHKGHLFGRMAHDRGHRLNGSTALKVCSQNGKRIRGACRQAQQGENVGEQRVGIDFGISEDLLDEQRRRLRIGTRRNVEHANHQIDNGVECVVATMTRALDRDDAAIQRGSLGDDGVGQSGLANAGLARHDDRSSVTCHCRQQGRMQCIVFGMATDELTGRLADGQRGSAAIARQSKHRIHSQRMIKTLDLMMNDGLQHKQITNEPTRRLGDTYEAGRCHTLHPCGGVGSVAEREQLASSASDFVDNDGACVNADSRLKANSCFAKPVAEPAQRLVDSQCGAYSPFWIVLAGRRKAKVRDDPIALHLRDVTTIRLDGTSRLPDICLDQICVLFGIELLAD